jgi:DNA-binding transcriptional regulator YiaG
VDSAAGSGTLPTRGITGTEDASRNAGQLRSTDLNETDLSSASGLHTVKHAAPVVTDHVRDRYDHIDKTRIEELREKTEVTQAVQPVYDEVKHDATHEQIDHGLEVCTPLPS